jgi:hypothetical protein
LLVAAHQQITRDWWESRRSEFDLYASELALKEVRAGDATLASRRLELLRDGFCATRPTTLSISRSLPRIGVSFC